MVAGGLQPQRPEERRQGLQVPVPAQPMQRERGRLYSFVGRVRTGMRQSVKVEGEAQY